MEVRRSHRNIIRKQANRIRPPVHHAIDLYPLTRPVKPEESSIAGLGTVLRINLFRSALRTTP